MDVKYNSPNPSCITVCGSAYNELLYIGILIPSDIIHSYGIYICRQYTFIIQIPVIPKVATLKPIYVIFGSTIRIHPYSYVYIAILDWHCYFSFSLLVGKNAPEYSYQQVIKLKCSFYYSGPPPYTEADCMDDCQLTYCQACYHSNTTLPTPPGCVSHTVNDKVCKGCLCCLREWTRCVEVRNVRDNEVHMHLQ